MLTACGRPQGGVVRLIWTHVNRGGEFKNLISCGRHKWMTPNSHSNRSAVVVVIVIVSVVVAAAAEVIIIIINVTTMVILIITVIMLITIILIDNNNNNNNINSRSSYINNISRL